MPVRASDKGKPDVRVLPEDVRFRTGVQRAAFCLWPSRFGRRSATRRSRCFWAGHARRHGCFFLLCALPFKFNECCSWKRVKKGLEHRVCVVLTDAFIATQTLCHPFLHIPVTSKKSTWIPRLKPQSESLFTWLCQVLQLVCMSLPEITGFWYQGPLTVQDCCPSVG